MWQLSIYTLSIDLRCELSVVPLCGMTCASLTPGGSPGWIFKTLVAFWEERDGPEINIEVKKKAFGGLVYRFWGSRFRFFSTIFGSCDFSFSSNPASCACPLLYAHSSPVILG